MMINRFNFVPNILRRLSYTDLHNISNNLHGGTTILACNNKVNNYETELNFRKRSLSLCSKSEYLSIKRMSSLPPSESNTTTTKEIIINEKKTTNRLALEKSPYLLQHSTNPVDWYPWGEEAFDKAKKENKIIFLSVGYSTCHWCHVMEKESFENNEIAKIMNKYFINIKVDREERPDVDKLYMSFIQAINNGGGGWPMSVFLSPTLEPLTGGTYFPPIDNYGRPGFKTILLTINEQWTNKQTILINSGKKTIEMLRKLNNKQQQEAEEDVVTNKNEQIWLKCLMQLNKSYDETYGGFSIKPKFPQPTILNFLFHLYSYERNTENGKLCLDMCLNTLNHLANGGIFDHINYGFSRYSVDNKWHIPHFEKMLYDQSQLIISFIDAYVVTKNDFYLTIVTNCLLYVKRDLSHRLGGFYSAEDADSLPLPNSFNKQEGAFYVWEFNEIFNLLDNQNEAEIFCYYYNIKINGNVEEQYDPHNELKNKNILIITNTLEETAKKFQIEIKQLKEILDKSRKILFNERQKRPKPQTDTKIVTSWNGLMISSFARAGFVLKQQTYTNRAILAANFIKQFLYNENNNTLLRCCYKADEENVTQISTPIEGFLDDYAFLIRGLLDLYEASLDVDWLMWAETLQEQQNRLFWDENNFGYFTSSVTDDSILIRGKDDSDGAEPCGNSVSVHNLLRLSAYLDRKDLRTKAGLTLKAFSERLKLIPISLPEMTSALLFYHNSPTQVFIAGETEDNQTQALIDVLRKRFIPGKILAVTNGHSGPLHCRHETFSHLKRINGKSAAYVCRNFTCSLPVTEPDELESSLDDSSSR